MFKLKLFFSSKTIYRVFTLLVFSSFFSCTHIRSQKKAKADNYIEMGKSYLMNKNYPSSFDVFFKARDLDPSNPVIFNYIGLTYFLKRKYDLAEKAFKKALKLDKNYTQARIHLGELFLVMGLTQFAIQTLETAAKDITYEQQDKIFLNLGIAYLIQKNFPKAKKNLEEALSLAPRNCTIRTYYGRFLFEKKNYAQAIVQFNKSEKVCKNNKEKKNEILYYKALCYFQMDQNQKAKMFWNEIVKSSSSEKYVRKATNMLNLLKL